MLIHFVGMFRVNCSSIPVLTVWSKQNTIVFGKLQILRLDFLYANVHIGEFVDLLSLSFWRPLLVIAFLSYLAYKSISQSTFFLYEYVQASG